MTQVEVFADIVCPFSHVGLRRLSEAHHGCAVPPSPRVWAWPLEWINGTPLGPDLLAREVDALRARVAPELFTGFDATLFPLTSIPAFGLADAAYLLNDATGAAVSLAIRDALFEHGQDISDTDVLRAIGRRFEVDPLDHASAEFAARIDWQRGTARGVQGSPHFFVGDRGWFCPSLDISHDGERFDIQIADDRMRDFYEASLA